MQGGLNAYQQAEQNLRHHLLGLGLTEVLTLSFSNPAAVKQLVGPDHPWNQGLVLQNPLSSERSLMRPSLLMGLLDVLAYNAARQQHDLAIFEIATVFKPLPGESLQQPEEPLHLGIACMGKRSGGWQTTTSDYDFFYVKGLLETILAKYNMSELVWRRATEPFLHPGRAAVIYWKEAPLGYVGELHPDIVQRYDLRQRAVVAELKLEPVLRNADHLLPYQGIPKYPAVERDLAVVVDQHIPAFEVESIIREVGGELLVALELFDVYQGEQIAEQKKSLAYALTWQSLNKTLQDNEIATLHEKIVAELNSRLGAELR